MRRSTQQPRIRSTGWQSKLWIGVAMTASVVASAMTAAPRASTASAAAPTPGRLCSGLQTSGSFYNPSDNASYKVYVPAGATLTVSGSVDVIADAGGFVGWQSAFTMTPWFNATWTMGNYRGGPYYNQPFSSAPWTNNGGAGDITVTASQGYSSRIDWRFTVTVSTGGGTGPCTPLAPRETLPCNCAAPHAAASQGRAGDPVDTATGNFHEAFHDFAIPGRGPGLVLNHAYSSLIAGDDGPLGFGWTNSYGMSLAVNATSGVATVRQESGAEVYLYPNGAGGFEAPARAVATLVHNADGSYTFKRRNQTTMGFSSTGQLTSIADRNGYSTTLQYTAGQLSTVTDAGKRQLHVGWTGSHITSVSDSSSPARTVTFAYDRLGNLTDNTDVGASAWHFTYDSAHHLQTVRRPRQAAVKKAPVTTNVYDAAAGSPPRSTSSTARPSSTTPRSPTPRR